MEREKRFSDLATEIFGKCKDYDPECLGCQALGIAKELDHAAENGFFPSLDDICDEDEIDSKTQNIALLVGTVCIAVIGCLLIVNISLDDYYKHREREAKNAMTRNP